VSSPPGLGDPTELRRPETAAAIVESVRAGDPAVAANAIRLRAIASCSLHCSFSLVIGGIAKTISTWRILHLNAGFQSTVARPLTFLLARVRGRHASCATTRRDDLMAIAVG
jgi:hypothetical protein